MRKVVILFALLTVFALPAQAKKEVSADSAVSLQKENLFAKHFFMNPDQRLMHETLNVRGFSFVETPDTALNTRYSIITNFGGNAIKTQLVPNLMDFSEIRKWIDDVLETAEFEGVEVRKLMILTGTGEGRVLYWVGNKAFATPEEARAEIALIQAFVETNGGNFKQMVKDVQSAFYQAPEPVEEPVVVKTRAQQQKEEELFLKYLDAMDIGEKLFGPFQGEPVGQPIVWQSFGETSWRTTNLDKKNFGEQVGYYTNRFVFKGIRAPLNTVDPYLEVTGSMESDGIDFKDKLEFIAGLEWRPLERNTFLTNYRPYGLALLTWVKSYRAFLEYKTRVNLKDQIENSDNHDLQTGVSIFYEYGIDLPPLNQGRPQGFAELLERYVWGDYFGRYVFSATNFSSEDDYDSWSANSNVRLGFKTPGIPLPANPLTDELVLMPYMIFEHVNTGEFSEAFQNRYFVGAGLRWMPFRDYRHKENEWLFKTKLFVEYIGIGKVHYGKQSDVSGDIRTDLRFGVNISSNRY